MFLPGIVVAVGRHFARPKDMVEPAGQQQAREGSRPGEPALAFIFMQAGMAEPARRMPADRLALVLAIGDVESAVDQCGEAQAAAGAEFQHADAALDAVAKRHQPHAGELRQHARPFGNLPPRKRLTVELYHQLRLGCP